MNTSTSTAMNHTQYNKGPQYSQRLLDAAKEARRISRDPDTPGYTNMDNLRKALEE